MKNVKIDSVALVLLILFFVMMVNNDLGKLEEQEALGKKIEKEIADEISSGTGNSKKLASLKDDDFIELIARQKLGLIKKGEVPYRIVVQD